MSSAPMSTEAATVDQLAGEVVQQRGERRQREVVGGDVEHVVGARAGVAERRVELGELIGGQVQRPHVDVADVARPPLRLRLEFVHRLGRGRSDHGGRASVPGTDARPWSVSVAVMRGRRRVGLRTADQAAGQRVGGLAVVVGHLAGDDRVAASRRRAAAGAGRRRAGRARSSACAGGGRSKSMTFTSAR